MHIRGRSVIRVYIFRFLLPSTSMHVPFPTILSQLLGERRFLLDGQLPGSGTNGTKKLKEAWEAKLMYIIKCKRKGDRVKILSGWALGRVIEENWE